MPMRRLARLSRLITRRVTCPEGCVRTISNLSNGAAVRHGTSASNIAGIHGCQGSIRTLNDVLPRDVAHHSLMATRDFNTSCFPAASRTNCPSVNTPSVIIKHLKPTFVGSLREAKRHFSSDKAMRYQMSRRAKRAAWVAKWDAESAALKARCADWGDKIDAEVADFNKSLMTQMCLWGIICGCWIGVAILGENNSAGSCKRQNKDSGHCSSCCSGQCGVSES